MASPARSIEALEVVEDQVPARSGDVVRLRRRAAVGGALKLGLPAIGLAAGVTMGLDLAAPVLEAFLAQSSVGGLLALFFGTCFLGPALLAMPLAALASWVARRASRAGEDIGMAAAAGAGLATAGITFGWVAARAHSLTEFLIAVPMLVGAAVITGLVGHASFAAVRPDPGQQKYRERKVPLFYQTLQATGVGGAVLFLSAAVWVLAAQVVPALGLEWLGAYFPSAARDLMTHAVTLGLLAPASYLSARVLARPRSRGAKLALGVGLMAPVLVPVVSKMGFAMLYAGVYPNPYVPMVLGYLAGTLPHALAISAGFAAGEEDPLLTAGNEEPALLSA